MKWLNFTLGAVLLVAAAVFIAVKFGSFKLQQLEHEVQRLEQERQRLIDYAQRLSATRRVAQVEVLGQRTDAAGHTVSTLLWQELGPDGALGRPVTLEVVGNQVYFEALVIKFRHQYVQEGDRERGFSLALFRRTFGDQQSPESVPDIDRAARPPINDASKSPALQDQLWERFWEFVDRPDIAARFGVRVAQCEAPSVRLQMSDVIEVTLDSAGGINLKKLPPRIGNSAAPGADGRP